MGFDVRYTIITCESNDGIFLSLRNVNYVQNITFLK